MMNARSLCCLTCALMIFFAVGHVILKQKVTADEASTQELPAKTVYPKQVLLSYDENGKITERLSIYSTTTSHYVYTNGTLASSVTLSRCQGTLDGKEMLYDTNGKIKEIRTFLGGVWIEHEHRTSEGKEPTVEREANPNLASRYRNDKPYHGIFFVDFPKKGEIHVKIFKKGQLLEVRPIRYLCKPSICRDNPLKKTPNKAMNADK